MTWIVSDARVLASAEVASTRAERRRGLLGRDHVDGALLLPSCRWVHTFGMRFDLDVAFLDGEGRVLSTRRMKRQRLGLPVPAARTVIEAEAGAFARWGLRPGDVVELRRSTSPDDRDDHGVHGPSGPGRPGHCAPGEERAVSDATTGTGSVDDAASPRVVRRLEPATA
ncbi:MAG: DUF192 domain-containing protein [Actinomycetota bacterium]